MTAQGNTNDIHPAETSFASGCGDGNCGNAIKQFSKIDHNCTLFAAAIFIVTKSLLRFEKLNPNLSHRNLTSSPNSGDSSVGQRQLAAINISTALLISRSFSGKNIAIGYRVAREPGKTALCLFLGSCHHFQQYLHRRTICSQ